MKFESTEYVNEMKQMVDEALVKIQREHPGFEVYTASIWTDPNAAASTINFESKRNSDEQCRKTNEFNKEQVEYHVAEGDLEMAELFKEPALRNDNPADFELSNFLTIKNSAVPHHWEEETEGQCWEELEPALKEVGEYAFKKMVTGKVHEDFEVAVNGAQDWYEFTWRKG